MRLTRRRAVAIGVLFTALVAGASARAADIAPDGTLVFAGDALATCGFESPADLQSAGAQGITWSARGVLVTTPMEPGDETRILTGAADALEGSHGLLLRHGLGAGLALRETAVLAASAGRRISVSMWGRAHGAEPVLEVVYSHNDRNVGPSLMRVVAIRTGRETSDGWVEYATGPVDGTVFTAPLRAIVLTARYATNLGASTLIAPELSPAAPSPPRILDPDAYAVIDAVEVRPEPGSPQSDAATCTQATVDTACGASGECELGHCVDGSVVWGPVPEAADHRADLVARWAFLAQHLLADRKATATAATTFAGAAEALGAVTTPRGYYGQLNQLVTGLRDSHTVVGGPPSASSVAFPLLDAFSGPLDVCFGPAEDDLGSGKRVFAVFAVGSHAAIVETLEKGDVLTAVDGIDPDTWIAAVLPRFAPRQPNDPASDPSQTALWLPKLVGRYAHTLTFSRCQTGGGCAPLPDIPVADEVYAQVSANLGYPGSSLICSPRFHGAVSSPPPDGSASDAVVEETVNAVTSVQFDGFAGAHSSRNGWQTWEDPWIDAFTGNARVLVDARLGHGGKFVLGNWLFRLLRGTDQPYGDFAMPRGAYDDPDPAWLFGPSWDACATGDDAVDACTWTGGQTSFTDVAAPLGEAAKVAWVNGNDVSMNDIVPRLLAGRSNFRIFAPHPSQGAYGEVSYVPPIEPTWTRGSIQVLDLRFGATLAAARAAGWESGKGVQPDQVVVQKVSDVLIDHDTVLDAAMAWVSQ